MTRGKRESQWQVVRRCLIIVRRVLRGPASRVELAAAVETEEGPEAYGDADGFARQRRIENDLRRIREILDIDLSFDRQAGGYVVGADGAPLLDLPDADLSTLAWLQETFHPQAPQHEAIHGLIDRLQRLLDPRRRAEIERCRTALSLDLGQRDQDRIDDQVWEPLTRALVERRQIEFDYRSPQQPDQVPRRHRVAPYERYFDPTRGHYYLRGWCHYTDGPFGRIDQEHYMTYRLGRIERLEVLPIKLPPTPPRAPVYEVQYELAPAVARLGVTRHPQIEVTEVTPREDGSALVQGTTTDLFGTTRTLLHYGANCRVLGGIELLREVKSVVGQMAELYKKQE